MARQNRRPAEGAFTGVPCEDYPEGLRLDRVALGIPVGSRACRPTVSAAPYRLVGQFTQDLRRQNPEQSPSAVHRSVLEARNAGLLQLREDVARTHQLRNQQIEMRRMAETDHLLRPEPLQFLDRVG